MTTETHRALCDVDDDRPRCDGCGGVMDPCDDDDEESPVIYACFHALHAACAHGRDACPRCHTPRQVHDDDDEQPEQADSPPDYNPDEDEDEEEEEASDGMGKEPEPFGCCCAYSSPRRVNELEGRVCRLEEMHGKLEEELVRLRDGKRARETEDDAEEEEEEEEAAERQRRKERFVKAHTARPH